MKYKKIYVLTPYNYCTGGVELAHQLVSRLRDKGEDAYVVYTKPPISISSNQDITPNYSAYNLKATNEIEDEECNFLIVPEIYFEYIQYYKKINIGCWWMSVDNRYKRASFKECFSFSNDFETKIRLIYHYFKNDIYKYQNNNRLIQEEGDRIIHLYQSHYAQFHLYSKGFSRLAPLSDYINLELVGNCSNKREDIVLYNPAKGKKFTELVIKNLPSVRFIPLKGLNRAELQQLLGKAKLYIDFGHFPGKDRLPREAVVNGCCIITGKLGASFFYEDVPIGITYKFDCNKSNLKKIVEKIKYVISNYELCKGDFDEYRSKVLKEQEIFYSEINDLFCK